jgi:hypothetical protein
LRVERSRNPIHGSVILPHVPYLGASPQSLLQISELAFKDTLKSATHNRFLSDLAGVCG